MKVPERPRTDLGSLEDIYCVQDLLLCLESYKARIERL